MLETLGEIVSESWLVLGQMGPYLIFGFLVAGLLSVWVSPAWLERHLGGRGAGPIFKASFFGVPLPLCSCGVIPVAASLRRHGASRAATTAFLLSTPQTGVDSILVTAAMLGPLFAVYRPVVALLTGFLGGGLVASFGESANGAAGGSGPGPAACTDDCCAGDQGEGKLRRALRYGLVTLPADIGAPLLIGAAIAGMMSALIPPDSLEVYLGGGVLSILILMAAGVPLYVCATASVPIAAGFLHLGASPGAALAFLIAGPATNAATFTTVWKVIGRRTAFLFLGTVAASAFGFGTLLNWLAPVARQAMPQLAVHEHLQSEAGLVYHLSAVFLLAVLANSVWLRPRHARSQVSAPEPGPGAGSERLELQVEGMTCSHCAESVRRAVGEVPGVRSAEVNLAAGTARVTGQDLAGEDLVNAVSSLGFSARILEP